MARLVEVGGAQPGRYFPLVAPECVLGRAPDCDIAVADQRISRHHARLVRTPEGLRIEDLGSVNGTYLNKRRVRGQVELSDGDEIAVGGSRFTVDLSDEPHALVAAEGRVTVLDVDAARASVVEVAHLRHTDALRAAPADAAREVDRLQHKLRTLYALGETIASALEPRELLGKVVALLLDVFPQAATAAAVVLDPRSHELRTLAFRSRDTSVAPAVAIPANVVDRVLRQGRSVLLRAVGERGSSPDGPRVTLVAPPPGDPSGAVGFRMGAPLMVKGEPLGILHVDALPEVGSFSQSDLDLLGGIAAQAGVALHLARLHQRVLAKDRIEKDLVIARQIQRNLLPREPPRVSGLDFAVHYEPAYHVGGDFFDFLWVDPTHLAIVVGDVSGKAISGALFMARVASEFRANAPLGASPARLIQRVNRAVVQVAEDGMFCTALVLVVDLERHVARFASAGHTMPVLQRDGRALSVEDPRARALPLGVDAEIAVDEAEIELRAGDALMLYTDGLIEAQSPAGEFYGTARLLQAMSGPRGPARAAVDAVLRDIDAFVGDAAQADDQTMVVVSVADASSRRVESLFPPRMPAP